MYIRYLLAAAQRMAAALPQAILRWRPDRFTLTLAALALLGTALILARQVNYGVHIEWDSINFITVARNLLAGEGFTIARNLLVGEGFVELSTKTDFILTPPLYSLLLAGATLFIFDPLDVAGPLNAAIFGLTIFAAGQWLRQRIHSRFLILWSCLAILFALPLVQWASMAMTDTPFILFVTLALLHTDNFLHQGKQASLLWAAVFTALACLTRYIGPALIFTVLPLLLFQHGIAPFEKLKRIGLYAAVSATPIGLWLLRNFLRFDSPMGGRPPLNYALPEILDAVISHLTRWLFLELSLGEFQVFAEAVTGLALLVLVIALGVTLRAQQKAAAWTDLISLCLFPAFTLVYFILFIQAIQTSGVGPPRYRYLLPVYIPLLFTAVLVIDRFLRYERQRKLLGIINDLPFIRTIIPRRVKQVSLLTVLLSAVLSLWLGWSVPINARDIRQVNMPTSGVGRTYLSFADSQAFQYMREHSIDGAIVSNLWQGIIYLPTTEYHPLYLLRYWPALTVAAPYSRRADYHHMLSSEQWNRYVARLFIGNTDDDVYLVWFYGSKGTWFYGGFQTPNLDTLPELEPVAELEDGVILKVNKAYGNADAYRAITATQPLVRSNFNLHLNDNTLHYVRDTCRPDDIQARFFLHMVPHDTNDLPQHRQQYGFVNLDFVFYDHGVRFNGKCLASVPLPDYPIVYIKTGQGIPPREDKLWEGAFPILNVNNAYGAEAYQSIVAGQAVLRAHFDIYLNDNSLHYVRDTCRPDDIQARFFLHIMPHDTNDLPQHRQQYGFDNLDFTFYQHGVRFDGKCLASVPLPDYPIARINTGQWIPDEGKLWEGEFPFHEEP